MNEVKNELDQRFLNADGLNIAPGTVSGSRKQMFASHMGQTVVIEKPSDRSMLTGMEQETGKYTFAQKMPENGRILNIFDRYPPSYGEESFLLNPERLVIYESESGKIGMFIIKMFHSDHPYFGFDYKSQSGNSKLAIDKYIPKGTVFYDSPNKDEDGNYRYGLELNIGYVTHPGTSDDGIVISKDVLPKLTTRTYERRVIEWGKNSYPLNLYGTDDNYKIFPEIGDYVHPSNEHKGLLMALRDYDPSLLLIDQSKKALKTVDHFFDRCTYVNGAGGKVVDIIIRHQSPSKGSSICDEMMAQPIRYRDAYINYRKKIVDWYFSFVKQRRGLNVNLTPELHHFLVDSLAIIKYSNSPNKGRDNLRYIHKTNNVNEWRAEFVIEYLKVPTVGYKLTDTAGGKGVICKILEPEQMPVAENGIRADIMMDPASNVNRMKFSSLYEQYLNVAKYDLRKEFLKVLGLSEKEVELSEKDAVSKPTQPTVVDYTLKNADNDSINYIINRLGRYHEIVSPKQFEWFNSISFDAKIKYIGGCIKDKIYDYFPPDNQVYLPTMVANIEKEFKPTYGPVTFKDENGNLVKTKKNIRIGPVYIILLEKIGAEWASVSLSKTQQNGIITYIAGKDKNTSPIKTQAVRVLGEAETRGISSYIGADFAAELHDRSNNISVRKIIAQNILSATYPTNMDHVIDRDKNKLGYSQPLQIFYHIINCAGFTLEYKKYDPTKQKPKQDKETDN